DGVLIRPARVACSVMTSTDARVVRPRAAFTGPGMQVNGLEAAPEGVWLCDQRDNRSYLVDYSGHVLTSFASPARNASGISLGADTGHLVASFAFPAPRSHGMYWDPPDATLNIAETNGGHVFRFEPSSGELLSEWRIEGPEVHGFTRSADGRIWIGDASTNRV